MHIELLTCPMCEGRFVVDGSLWEIGTVRLRCAHCAHMFLPEGSPRTRTVEKVTNSSVAIEIWEPEEES